MGRRTGRTLATLVATALVMSLTAIPASAATAADAKNDVADRVEALADTDSRRLNAALNRAADIIRGGTADENWNGEQPASVATFRADVEANRIMRRVARRADRRGIDGLGSLWDLRLELAKIDGGLAHDQVDAAAAANPDDDRLARAQRRLARGDEALANGRANRAIRRYARAWQIATNILADGPTDPPANPAVSIATNWQFNGGVWQDGDDAANPPTVFDTDGINIQWLVTNTGDVTLSDVTVTDSVFTGLTCTTASLAPGATLDCTQNFVSLAVGSHVNTGTVTATYDGATLTDSNSVYLTVELGDEG